MNRTEKQRRSRTASTKRKAPRRKTMAELNAWMKANYDGLLEKAKRNCIELTGKPAFGGTRARKSA